MNKHASIESKIVEFFETAPLTSVEIVLGIVKEKVRGRQPQQRRKAKSNGTIAEAPVHEVRV